MSDKIEKAFEHLVSTLPESERKRWLTRAGLIDPNRPETAQEWVEWAREYFEANQINISGFAQKYGIARQTIANTLSGRHKPSPKVIRVFKEVSGYD